MQHPRIIRALELLHDLKNQIAASPCPQDSGCAWVSTLGTVEDELLTHVAEAKRAERAHGAAL